MKQKKNRKLPPQQGAKAKAPTDLALIGLTALIVARPIVPEDPGGQAGYGVAFIMLWLLLAMGWLAQQCRTKKPIEQFDLVDWLVIAAIGWHSLAAVVAAWAASPRPAFNVLWEWVGMGLAFLLARRILSPEATARAVIAIVIGLAVGLSLVAFEQRFVSIPADLRAFDANRDDPARLFELTGQWLPPGSSELKQFENRINSQQPTATFALANSLAGFLVPWLILLASVWSSAAFRSAAGRPRFVAGGLALLALLATLYFTSSRTAILAAVFGLAALAWRRVPATRRKLAGVAILVATLIGTGAVAWQTGYGREALSGARRSFAFRADYWRATLAMIADRPLLGCGPGQFQDAYAHYKLPTASEEIQDPHNWLLEISATAGIPAGILLAALLILIAWRITHSKMEDSLVSDMGDAIEPPIGAGLGLLLGCALAFANGFPPSLRQSAIIAIGIGAMWWVLRPWVRTGKLDTKTILIAAAALLLDLTAAGGIGYPSVADSLWLLAAIGMRISGERKSGSTMPASARTRVALLSVAAGLFVLAYLTAYRPVTNARAALARADAANLRGQFAEHSAAATAAVQADPWSAPAALQLLSLRLAEYTSRPTADHADAVTNASEELLRLAPHNSGAHVRASEAAEAIYEQSSDPKYLQSAITYQREAGAIYPTSAKIHARLAGLLLDAGERASAAESASAALRLDDFMRLGGHADRQLSDGARAELHNIANGEATFDAEKPRAIE